MAEARTRLATVIEQPDAKRMGFLDRATVTPTNRAWWQARYSDGTTLYEWATPPDINTRTVRPTPDGWRATRWEEVKKTGMVGLRLLCPNGMYGELRTNNPEGRFVHFKTGGEAIAMGFGPMAGYLQRSGHYTVATVIGVVADDGTGFFWAWENMPHAFVGHEIDNLCTTCRLDKAHCGGRNAWYELYDELIEVVPDPVWPERKERSRVMKSKLRGSVHPLVAFRDDVRQMHYRNTGPLADVQGVKL